MNHPPDTIAILTKQFMDALNSLIPKEPKEDAESIGDMALLLSLLFYFVTDPTRDKQTVKDLFEKLLEELLEKHSSAMLTRIEIHESIRQLREIYGQMNSNRPSYENQDNRYKTI